MRPGAFVLALLLPLAACVTPPERARAISDGPADGTATSSDGTRIAFRVRGEGNEAVVLVHGWACDRTIWDGTVENLAPAYRVVTLDLAGHGESTSGRTDWTMEAFGEDVRAVVDLLGSHRVVLVGHDMGGPVVLEAARRLGERVVGVVAVDSLHDVDRPYDEAEWNAFLDMYRRDFQGTCSRFVVSMFGEEADPDLVVRTGKTMCGGADPELAITLLEMFPRYDRANGLAAVRAPVRCINSAMIPTDWRGNGDIHPDFAVTVMPGVGHFPMLEAPDDFRRVLRETLAELFGS